MHKVGNPNLWRTLNSVSKSLDIFLLALTEQSSSTGLQTHNLTEFGNHADIRFYAQRRFTAHQSIDTAETLHRNRTRTKFVWARAGSPLQSLVFTGLNVLPECKRLMRGLKILRIWYGRLALCTRELFVINYVTRWETVSMPVSHFPIRWYNHSIITIASLTNVGRYAVKILRTEWTEFLELTKAPRYDSPIPQLQYLRLVNSEVHLAGLW